MGNDAGRLNQLVLQEPGLKSYYGKALSSLKVGNYEDALDAATIAIGFDAEASKVWHIRAEANEKLGKVEQSKADIAMAESLETKR